MKIFIDIGHPAHVHYFRNFIEIMLNRGHLFLVTARDKDVTHNLLDSYGIEYINRGAGGKGVIGKFLYMIRADYDILKLSRKFRPDVFISFSSPYTAQVSRLLCTPHIAFTDTEHATLGNLAFSPFSRKILTPNCFEKDFGQKHVRFNGYMELSYLHPEYFTADENIKEALDIKSGEKYTIMRFVSWEATHDIGHSGITNENKILAVSEFEKYGKVFISSEGKLPEVLEKNRLSIPKNKMHDALAFASMMYGESATMASESAILGVPSIFIDDAGRGYTNELEKEYGIVYNFTESLTDQSASIQRGIEILNQESSGERYRELGKEIIDKSINLTEYMISFIENKLYLS